MHDFYSSEAFEQAFTYQANDLGATWSPEKTVFRLWAPTAKEVSVNLYRSGTAGTSDLLYTIPMYHDKKGVWAVEADGNLNGIYYTYTVTVFGQAREVCDPYARTTGVNGNRAMVLDLRSTDPAGWDQDRNPFTGKSITDAVLYELHVRDLSIDRSSGIHQKGKFLGLSETKTKTRRGIPTGLAHIKNLGVTHVQLLPVYDYGSVDESRLEEKQFNWGYDPVNFNVPEGSYSTDPYNGAVRVMEMKQMIKALHDQGIGVVMDVVYNHVYHADAFSLNQIVPGYFSRKDSNGSCCGNDTASERSMVRKYIVDSVNYWADEYHIDGFRFDLVGLLDIQTITEAMETVRKNHPNAIFYGEGWSMDTRLTKTGYPMAVQGNSAKLPGFAFFNDTVRDLLRGSVFDITRSGFATGGYCDRGQLDACFMGIPHWAANPDQCVNYVSCHDNHTLFDRITLAVPHADVADRIKMNNLAAAFCMLAQGVPFFQAGEEFLRSKPGKNGAYESNSYRSSDKVNSLKWGDLSNEEYRRARNYYKGLISFRKAHKALRMTAKEEVCRNIHPQPCDNSHAAAYMIDGTEERIFAAFNADTQTISLPLPEGAWEVCIKDNTAGTKTLETLNGTVTVAPLSAAVLVQKMTVRPVDVVAALIWEKDKFLICQRPANKARGLLWEFVGGKVEPGETMAQGLIRECREELDITVDVGRQFMQVIHEYPDIRIRLTLFHCTIPEGFPKALEHNDIRWIHPRDMDLYDFCPADTEILKEIKRLYGNIHPL